MAAEYRTVLPDEKELAAEIERTQAMLQRRNGLHLASVEPLRAKAAAKPKGKPTRRTTGPYNETQQKRGKKTPR